MQNLRQRVYKLLRGSERFFKADMVYMAKGNSWQTSGQLVTSILSLVLLYFFANYLPKETYGTYRYILSLAGILSVFTLTGMNQAVTQAVANGKEGVLRTSVKYQLRWNVVQLVAFWTLGIYYFMNANHLFGASFFVLGLVLPIIAALNTYTAFLDGKKDFKLNNIFSIGGTSIYVAGMIFAILFSGETIWLVVTYSIATFISSIIFYFSTLKIYTQPATASEDTLKYGRSLTFLGFISPVASQIDKIVLTHFWGPAQLAIYSLAMVVPERATLFIKSLVGIGFPKFAVKTPEEINVVFYRRILQGMSFGLFIALAYIIVAPYLFHYLLPQYLESIYYSQIMAISFIFAMPNRYISLLLVSQKLLRRMLTINIIQNIMRTIMYVILGIWGGIFGLVVANILNSFIGMLINIKIWRIKS